MEYAIEVKDLVVNYKALGRYSIKQMLLSGKKGLNEEIHALKGVSFNVPKGDIWGIIGKNGGGKSTLLKAVGGIFSPTSGTVDLHGNSISLLSIGVGFNRELSGRENILLSGMLLGFSKEEVLSKVDEIIEFSELEDFIEMPVRTYSSGMYSKLAFSVAVTLDTDILLIDEVLSVGDEHFRIKSTEKMNSMIMDKNHTVLIVSHSLKTIESLCTKVIWLHDGEIKMIDEPKKVLPEYQKFMGKK